MSEIATDILVCMPAGIALLMFLCVAGGWGLGKRAR